MPKRVAPLGDPSTSQMPDFTAYLDASGTHEGSDVVGFSGLLSAGRLWGRFVKDWSNGLAHAPKVVTVLHFGEFFSALGAFHRWTDDDRHNLMSKLGPAISRAAILAFGILVRTRDYYEVLSREAQALYGEPVNLCLEYALSHVLHWSRQHRGLSKGDRIGIIIDHDNKPRMQAWQRVYLDFKGRYDDTDRLALTPIFGARAKHVPLQAADVIAHQMYQHIRDGILESGNIREVLRWSLAGVPNVTGILKRENLAIHERILIEEGRLPSRGPLA